METKWLNVTSKEFKELVKTSRGLCLLPMGCIERHGNHLPLGTDVLEGEAVAYEASKSTQVCVAPPFLFGDVPEGDSHMHPGSISLSLELEMKLLEELLEQIARNGFRKILICNSHGGNVTWLEAFMRKMENKKHDFVVMYAKVGFLECRKLVEAIQLQGKDHFPTLTDEDVKALEEHAEEYRQDGHGGYNETALMMNYFPEIVKFDQLGTTSGLSKHVSDEYRAHGVHLHSGGWRLDFPNALSGADPLILNSRIAAAATQLEVEKLEDTIRFLKENDDCLKWHNEYWDDHLQVDTYSGLEGNF